MQRIGATAADKALARHWAWLLTAATYTLLVLLRRGVLSPHIALAQTPAIWPAGAVLVAGLLWMPERHRMRCIAACFAGMLLIIPLYGFTIRMVFSIVEGGSIAFLARRLCGPKPNFSDARKLMVFLGGAVIPSCLFTAALLFLSNIEPIARVESGHVDFIRSLQWFIGHSLGAAVFAPALVILLDDRRFRSLRRPPLELACALATVVAVAYGLFFSQNPATWFLLFPVLMLLAFRYGPRGAAAGAMIISLLAVARIYALRGGAGGDIPVLAIQFFVVLVFITTLPAAGAVASFARTRSLLAARTQTARLARREADAAAAAKGEFLANMSHEIRTPLNGVIGLADALSRTDLSPQQRDMLRMILSSGKALTGLLSDALDLARAESGSLSLAAERFDLREVISEAAYLFESLAREKGLAFEVSFDTDPTGAVVGDPLRLKQIVSNMISNAVKFTAQGSVKIEVSLRSVGEGGWLAVRVRDTGPGFDEAVRARLFSRFEQGDSSVTRRFGGTGLGLAIAQRLAMLMGGRIECEAAVGCGATFTFQAPLGRAQAASPAVADDEDACPITERALSILLAEDNLVNQKVVQAMLSDFVDLTVVPDGAQAVQAAAAEAFDVILMDTHMPVMDGHSAIRAIRAAERRGGRARTPIISLTADAMPQQVAAALAAGADLHVAKPITAETLIGALRTALQQRPSAAAEVA